MCWKGIEELRFAVRTLAVVFGFFFVFFLTFPGLLYGCCTKLKSGESPTLEIFLQISLTGGAKEVSIFFQTYLVKNPSKL